MPTTTIERTWTQFPGEAHAQGDLLGVLPRWVPAERLAFTTQLFRRSGVERRHMVLSPEELILPGRTFAAKNAIYKRAVNDQIGRLCRRVIGDTTREDRATIDLLITASCTGFQIPAMDSLLIQELELPVHLRRLNLTEHGCAAGAAAIGLAHEWLASHPDRRALVVCSEFCSLAFQAEDFSDENLVSAALFGDGSAAVLLAGSDAGGAGELRVRSTFTEFFPATEHFMGFEVNDAGLKIKLSRDVVHFSRSELPGLFARACEAWEIPSPQTFSIGAVHPGGRRILEILEDVVGLSAAVTATSWQCLADYGNLSSVSVLCALDRLMRAPRSRSRAVGLLSAFGPGFGAELGMLELAPLAA
jgi:alkylresorcinol/alkylpyrone synthase